MPFAAFVTTATISSKCTLLLVESSKVFTQCQDAVCARRQT
jgi:hypothetical protein